MGYEFYKTPGQNTVQDYLKALFNDDESITICKDIYSKQHIRAGDYNPSMAPQYLCLNSGKDRKTKDIECFRNFLVEIDNVELKDQLAHIKNLEMPFSTLVYSGNMSFHYIISLEEPLSDIKQYQFVASWIQNIVKICDPQALLCAKLTRFPEALRPDSGKKQKLIKVNPRISSDVFLGWLQSHDSLKPRPKVVLPKPGEISGKFKDRSNLIVDLLWYIYEYLQKDYNGYSQKVQCPVCASEGRDNHHDNMCVSCEEMKFNCFANSDHNETIYRTILNLKRQALTQGTYGK
jgi:hypothetical protein